MHSTRLSVLPSDSQLLGMRRPRPHKIWVQKHIRVSARVRALCVCVCVRLRVYAYAPTWPRAHLSPTLRHRAKQGLHVAAPPQ